MSGRSSLFTLIALAVMFVGGFYIVTSFVTLNEINVIIGIVIATGGFIFLGRTRIRGRGSESSFVAIDMIAAVLIAVFFLTIWIGGLSGLLGNDQGTQNVVNFLLWGEVGGLVLTFVSGVFRFGGNVGIPQFNTELLWIAGNFAAIFVLNLVVPPSTYTLLNLSTLGPTNPFITVMIAIPETTVFQIWLAPWLANISKTGAVGGSFIGAIIATAYHLFVLGTNPAALGIVFGAFFVMNFTAIKGKLASIPMTNHLVNNALSALGFP